MKKKIILLSLLFSCANLTQAYWYHLKNSTGKDMYIMSRDDKIHWNQKNKLLLKSGATKKLYRFGKIRGPLRFYFKGGGEIDHHAYKEGEVFWQYEGEAFTVPVNLITPFGSYMHIIGPIEGEILKFNHLTPEEKKNYQHRTLLDQKNHNMIIKMSKPNSLKGKISRPFGIYETKNSKLNRFPKTSHW